MFLYVKDEKKLDTINLLPGIKIPDNTVWIDLLNMTAEEEKAVENFTGVIIPSREDMHEIEVSSRLYEEHNAVFMTATVVTQSDSLPPESNPFTFILVNDRLVTVRYTQSQAFLLFAQRVAKMPSSSFQGLFIFVGLMESIIDSTADVLERIGQSLDSLTSSIFFKTKENKNNARQDFSNILENIGHQGDLISKTRESLVSLNRTLSYAQQTIQHLQTGELSSLMQIVLKDAIELSNHANFLSSRVSFLLDATLGMINIEQNIIIKIFSIAAVILLPPTLIATIYGMNFKLIPGLDWEYGYYFALISMVLSAILPYLYFKKRKWL